MTESLHNELFAEPKSSVSLKLIAVIAAVVVSIGLLAGYAYLRQRHAGQTASTVAATAPVAAPKLPVKALIKIDDPTLEPGASTLAGTVVNTSNEPLSNLAVEMELFYRTGEASDKKTLPIEPSTLQPQQEGRYSVRVSTKDYEFGRLVALRSNSTAIGFNTSAGQARDREVTPSKTVNVDQKPGGKRDEFLNSPDNPARVP